MRHVAYAHGHYNDTKRVRESVGAMDGANLSEDGIPASSIAKDAQRPWGLHLEAKDPEKSRPEQWMVRGGVAE